MAGRAYACAVRLFRHAAARANGAPRHCRAVHILHICTIAIVKVYGVIPGWRTDGRDDSVAGGGTANLNFGDAVAWRTRPSTEQAAAGEIWYAAKRTFAAHSLLHSLVFLLRLCSALSLLYACCNKVYQILRFPGRMAVQPVSSRSASSYRCGMLLRAILSASLYILRAHAYLAFCAAA